MGSLQDTQQNWETFARADPMWAALMDPEKADGGWATDAFFATGEHEIATVLGCLSEVGVAVDFGGRALDFGCGIGRLTQALTGRFEAACGVDISPTMIALAREANHHPDRCAYILNESHDLGQFPDNEFVFIYTSVVLQHLDPRLAMGYLSEFARVLTPGGVLVFQIPDRVEPGQSVVERTAQVAHRVRQALGVRTRGRRLLRRIGLVSGPANARDAIAEMHCVPEATVRPLLARLGLEVLDVRLTNSTDLGFIGGLRYLDTPPSVGFVSKQYSATKPA
jgi:SAM-dependent methyltransferase